MIMADALRTCARVADFEKYVSVSLGPSLGSLANFGVLDAEGGAALFEVSNHAYNKYLASEFPEKYIVNTNFARSGEEGAGRGYLRFERASQLFREIPAGRISALQILVRFSRDTGHALVKQPAYPEFRSISGQKPVWIATRDTIDREATSAAVVVSGRKPGAEHSLATFWVQLGEPLFTVAVPLWVEAGAVPAPLQKGEKAPICLEAGRLKKLARPYPETDRREYLNASILDNREATGFLPGLLKAEQEIFHLTEEFLKTRRSPDELAAFQERMAAKALSALEAAH